MPGLVHIVLQFVPLNTSIVACPALLISARFKTFMIVIHTTLRSVHSVQWSTYHTSNLNFSVQLMALRPWHCAQPLIPGRTSCLRACSGEYSGRYCGSSGRGPISDMSPFRTLMSCGSSSIDVERTNLPTFVRRCASGNKPPSASRSSVIVLNLMTLKFFASLPGRS